MEIETRGAHSFLTMPQSRLWKANMMKRRMCVLMDQDRELSRLMSRARRKRSEKSEGRALKISIRDG